MSEGGGEEGQLCRGAAGTARRRGSRCLPLVPTRTPAPAARVPLAHRGDVTLEAAGPEPVTVAAATFDGGKHAVKPPAEVPLPAGAPAPAFA